jgi:hypothetical protein
MKDLGISLSPEHSREGRAGYVEGKRPNDSQQVPTGIMGTIFGSHGADLTPYLLPHTQAASQAFSQGLVVS